jgi:tetratricopeptide (TPR) repeat protein
VRSLARRLGLVLGAIVLAAILLRGSLSSALVSRGDALAYSGNAGRAAVMYRRALWFDAGNGAAVDRYVFAAIVSHDRRALGRGVDIASSYLLRNPGDATVRMDRALCFQRLQKRRAAAEDFELAGRALRDARALMFAALDERAMRERRGARRLLVLALEADPGFLPAKRALHAIGFSR